ncbi:hypothetical protein GCM10025864_24350 [Luteimicrobium album]|uniref:Uncharacterized protein n=1 Tax=Luteimicrobium album TaxID=1054550 RepID=A0ABQ6I336_9MICO|nr:hypothetical protein [Luteimicrobium album]GMA24676.1 hypothetical protein GCM10025864_24350 [Luteimicrobium album]
MAFGSLPDVGGKSHDTKKPEHLLQQVSGVDHNTNRKQEIVTKNILTQDADVVAQAAEDPREAFALGYAAGRTGVRDKPVPATYEAKAALIERLRATSGLPENAIEHAQDLLSSTSLTLEQAEGFVRQVATGWPRIPRPFTEPPAWLDEVGPWKPSLHIDHNVSGWSQTGVARIQYDEVAISLDYWEEVRDDGGHRIAVELNADELTIKEPLDLRLLADDLVFIAEVWEKSLEADK